MVTTAPSFCEYIVINSADVPWIYRYTTAPSFLGYMVIHIDVANILALIGKTEFWRPLPPAPSTVFQQGKSMWGYDRRLSWKQDIKILLIRRRGRLWETRNGYYATISANFNVKTMLIFSPPSIFPLPPPSGGINLGQLPLPAPPPLSYVTGHTTAPSFLG